MPELYTRDDAFKRLQNGDYEDEQSETKYGHQMFDAVRKDYSDADSRGIGIFFEWRCE